MNQDQTKTLMDIIEPIAKELRNLDTEITALNSKLKDLKTDREARSDYLVSELQQQGIETSVGLPDGGVIKLDTKVYPQVLNINGLVEWAAQNGHKLPVMQFNPATMQAWYNEQMKENLPMPPDDIVKSFVKTRAKVNKGG